MANDTPEQQRLGIDAAEIHPKTPQKFQLAYQVCSTALPTVAVIRPTDVQASKRRLTLTDRFEERDDPLRKVSSGTRCAS